jgi:hypothetical protein
MENPNNMDDVLAYKVINADGFKSSNRPRAQISQLRVPVKIAGPHTRMLTQCLNGPPHSIPKANGDFWKVYDGEVIAKLSNKVITGSCR